MIRRWFRHVVVSMLQGCAIFAVAAAVVATVATVVVKHALPSGFTFWLIAAIVVVSGMLGAAGSLAWRLSHISELAHVAEHGLHHDQPPAHP